MIACYIAMYTRPCCSGFYDEVTAFDVRYIKACFLSGWFREVQTSTSAHIVNDIDVAVQIINVDVAARILRNTAESFTCTSAFECIDTAACFVAFNLECLQATHVIVAPHATIKGHVDFATLIL